MPKSFILSYVEEKMRKESVGASPGPVITIAREYGCPAVPISHAVADTLSARSSQHDKWQVIDKQIINKAAADLQVDARLVEEVGRSAPPGFFREFISSFASQQDPADARVKRAIANVIRTVAYGGHAVILGRGGVAIARDIPQSLHVRLYAPLSYRKERAKELDNLKSDEEALQKIAAVDRERIYIRDYFAGERLTDDIFDVQFNCATLSQEQIIEAIVDMARSRFASRRA
ncbi:MAG: cytidylate kinase-like family protein [Leptospirales bacterium]|nr:cytidylate kinase-like family protein [Leptospirales bacterium]